jgi:thiamine-monophosphate kinase
MRKQEDELIQIFRNHITEKEELGLTDDAGVIDVEAGKLVVSSDVMSRKTHFPKGMSPFQMGRKAVIISLSDVASMGAKPLGVTVTFSLRKQDIEKIPDLAKGVNSACSEYGIKLLKGDTKQSYELIISSTAVGLCKKVLTRSGAKPIELICLTGPIGDAACGLMILLGKKKYKSEFLVKKALEPRARAKEGLILADYATSCIDVSDGLIWSLYELSRLSKVGFALNSEKVPLSKDCIRFLAKTGLRLKDISSIGEDFELLFTIPKEKLSEIQKKIEVFVIGEVTEGSEISIDGETVEPEGYSTF